LSHCHISSVHVIYPILTETQETTAHMNIFILFRRNMQVMKKTDSYRPHCFHSIEGVKKLTKQVYDSCTFCCAKLHYFISYFQYPKTPHIHVLFFVYIIILQLKKLSIFGLQLLTVKPVTDITCVYYVSLT